MQNIIKINYGIKNNDLKTEKEAMKLRCKAQKLRNDWKSEYQKVSFKEIVKQ